jgi:hypothetical protein
MSYESRKEDAVLLSRAFSAIQEMKNVEGFALTEDSYTARIPGKMLRDWAETVDKLQFWIQSRVGREA